MEVSNLLLAHPNSRLQTASDAHLQSPRHRTNPAELMGDGMIGAEMHQGSPVRSSHAVMPPAPYFPPPTGKNVTFELLLPESPQHRARLPMRVNIYPHDTTDSIITTVKNFYGLYEGKGVSFEDREGNTLIARYENFGNNMVVYVRALPDELEAACQVGQLAHDGRSPKKPRLDEPFQMLPPNPASRPSSRMARKRSVSPTSAGGRRSASAGTTTKARSRPGLRTRGPSSFESQVDTTADAANGYHGYSDSDGGSVSATSSRRARNEQLASAEISLDNIVEGGRRKRAKFDSSELPLFVPPQVPITTSISSASPHRRVGSHNGASPYSYTNQHTFAYPHPLPSPQAYTSMDISYLQSAQVNPYTPTSAQGQGHRLRTRGAMHRGPARPSVSSVPGLLPTPDPTIGSVISDEDVALQLMRLGDASNFSSHGRTSTSTLDDALSGKAEVASSAGDSDAASNVDVAETMEVDGLPRAHASMHGDGHVRLTEAHHALESVETSEEEYEDRRDASFKGESDGIMPDHAMADAVTGKTHLERIRTGNAHSAKTKGHTSGMKSAGKAAKPRPTVTKIKTKQLGSSKPPLSPASMPSQSRKTSIASVGLQHQLGLDDEDLSSKPRCQRCRKSKKGCDRQRPCQRCKDAGIGIEGCISEDEVNGRKGRYGRHMGVSVKKTPSETAYSSQAPSPSVMSGYQPPALAPAEKSKKRKR